MAVGFWQRWTIALGMTITALVILFSPIEKLCTSKPKIEYHKCDCKKEDYRVRDLIVYNNEQLKNLSVIAKKVRETREKEVEVKEQFFLELEREKILEQLSLPPCKTKVSSNSEEVRYLGKPHWIIDCVTWDRKWEIVPLEVEPHNLTADGLGPSEHRGHRKETFSQIFEKRDWPATETKYKGLQASGPGASLHNAQGAIAILHTVISKLKDYLKKSYITVLDVACGDLQWMSRLLLTRNDVYYTGIDIVPDIIQNHKKNFDNLIRAEFFQMDIVVESLNRSFDLVLCRDMLQHLWQADAIRALHSISKSNSKFLLATTYPDTSHNAEVDKDALGSRKSSYNLELPPFLMEPPICMSYDWNVEHLGLWKLPVKQKYPD